MADKNEEIQKLKQEVNKSMSDILEKDATFKQYYQKMQKEIKAAAMVKVLPHHRQHQLRVMEPQFQALLRVRHQVPFRVQVVVHQQQTDKRK